MGKTFKYTCWAGLSIFFYHLYLVVNRDKPEEGFGANQSFLEAAQFAYYGYKDLV